MQQTEAIPLKKVTVLVINDRDGYSDFLKTFGSIPKHSPYLCMRPVNADMGDETIFQFDVFGLSSGDKKVDDYVVTRDGLVILLDIVKYNNSVRNRVIEITNKLPPTMPLMIVFENKTYQQPRIVSFDDNQPIVPENIYNSLKQLETANRIIETVASSRFSNCYDAKTKFYNMMRNLKIQPTTPASMQITSKTIPINDMVKQFQDATMNLNLWDHYGRLRIVYYSISKYGFAETINPNGWLCTTWKAYKMTIGHGHLWHYTLTRFWANVLKNLMDKGQYTSFDALYNANSAIQSGKYFAEFYTNEVLFGDSSVARTQWVAPDKIPAQSK